MDVAGAEVAGAVVGGVGANTPRLTPHPGLAPPWVPSLLLRCHGVPASLLALLLLLMFSTGLRGMWRERGSALG